MAVPLPIPLASACSRATGPNSWMPDSPPANPCDVAGVTAKLDRMTVEIKELVGIDISLTDLIDLLYRFRPAT